MPAGEGGLGVHCLQGQRPSPAPTLHSFFIIAEVAAPRMPLLGFGKALSYVMQGAWLIQLGRMEFESEACCFESWVLFECWQLCLGAGSCLSVSVSALCHAQHAHFIRAVPRLCAVVWPPPLPQPLSLVHRPPPSAPHSPPCYPPPPSLPPTDHPQWSEAYSGGAGYAPFAFCMIGVTIAFCAVAFYAALAFLRDRGLVYLPLLAAEMVRARVCCIHQRDVRTATAGAAAAQSRSLWAPFVAPRRLRARTDAMASTRPWGWAPWRTAQVRGGRWGCPSNEERDPSDSHRLAVTICPCPSPPLPPADLFSDSARHSSGEASPLKRYGGNNGKLASLELSSGAYDGTHAV